MSDILGDVRYALRALGRSPGFATIAVLTLALGMGATTVIYSVARGVLFRPLPFRDPGRLVLAQDHQPPFTGSVAFEKLVPLLPPTCLFVWEMSPRKTVDEIRRSVSAWKERFGE